MSVTPQNARKEIFALIDGAWTAKAPAIIAPAGAPEMRYQGVEKGALPGSANYWGRASTHLVTTHQVAHICTPDPGRSPASFESRGLAQIQIFAPMSNTDPCSYAKGELLAELAQCMFMAAETPSGVWFRNPRINELPNDGTWYRWNVLSDFRFNQVKG